MKLPLRDEGQAEREAIAGWLHNVGFYRTKKIIMKELNTHQQTNKKKF